MPPQIEIALLRLVAECNGALNIGQSYSFEIGGKILRLSVEPVTESPPAPDTQCESDVYDAARLLINMHQRRVTAKEIFKELKLVEDPWKPSTVWKALATLCHKQLLDNRHDGRGYGLGPKSADTGDSHQLAG